jgi:uncharacterized membrane protein SirB2
MIEFYPEIRLLHIAAALTSGSLFFLRGLALEFGWNWAKARPVRRLSYAVDSVLLAAAIALMLLTGQYPLANSWLSAKVSALLIYIALGIGAFRTPRRGRRRMLWVCALATFAWIIAIAVTRDPLGPLAL